MEGNVKEISGNIQKPLDKVSEAIASSYDLESIKKMYSGQFLNNPEIRNVVLKNIKTMPYLPDRDTVENALSNPRNNEKLLRSIGSNLINTCYPLYKLIRFYSDILTYKGYVHSQGVKQEAMSKPRFNKEKRFVQQWIDKLQPERTFRRITSEVFKEGKRAYVWMDKYEKDVTNKFEEDDGNKIETISASFDEYNRKVKHVMLKELPDDYIKIVGISPNSYYTIAFNFAYFLGGNGVDIKDYPPVFKEYYDILNSAKGEFKTSKGKKSLFSFDEKKLGNLVVKSEYDSSKRSYCYWVDIPSTEAIVFSSDESTPIQAPNFMGLYLMSVDLQGYSMMQQQLTGIPLHSFIVGSIPVNPDNAKAPLVLESQAVNYYLDLINSIMPDGTRYFMTPSQDNKFFSFRDQPGSIKVYTSALQDLISSAGMSGLLSTTDKPSLAQIKTSQMLETRFADILYPQYVDCVNRKLDRLTNLGYLRYNWRYKMFGNKFDDKQDQEMVNKNLSLGQSFYLPKALAYQDLSMCDAEDLANEVIASGLYDKMIQLVSSYQSSGNEENKTGRPETKEPDNDNTAKSKESGSNTTDGRIVSALFSGELEGLSKEEMLDMIDALNNKLEDKG